MLNNTIPYIVVRCAVEGFHQWIDAPEEVAFLRNLHRHIFNIEVSIQVLGLDRELEYFMVRRKLMNWLEGGNSIKQNESCEAFATRIGLFIHETYGNNRMVTVSVFEDGENGSVVDFSPSDPYLGATDNETV